MSISLRLRSHTQEVTGSSPVPPSTRNPNVVDVGPICLSCRHVHHVVHQLRLNTGSNRLEMTSSFATRESRVQSSPAPPENQSQNRPRKLKCFRGRFPFDTNIDTNPIWYHRESDIDVIVLFTSSTPAWACQRGLWTRIQNTNGLKDPTLSTLLSTELSPHGIHALGLGLRLISATNQVSQ
jgi:hypothetical protein